MSVAALNTVGTVLRVGFYGVMGLTLFIDIFPSWVCRKGQIIAEGDLVNFCKDVARKYGIQKEVILIKKDEFLPAGTNVLPGSAVLEVPSNAILDDQTKNEIEFHMAVIRLNARPMICIIPMILAIAARYLLIARFPTGTTWAELGIGTIAFFVARYRYSHAIEEYVKEVRRSPL